MRRFLTAVALLAGVVGANEPLPLNPERASAIRRGLEFLRSQSAALKDEEIPLAALALIKGRSALKQPTDPLVKELALRYAPRCRGEYAPARGRNSGADNYEAACALLMFGAADPIRWRPEMALLRDHLIRKQTAAGAWHYSGRDPLEGDTSMTQYGLLGLWEASRHGLEVPPEVWDRACHWLCRTQDPSGGFGYHARVPAGAALEPRAVTSSMAAAGVCGLLIARLQLPPELLKAAGKAWREFDLLTRAIAARAVERLMPATGSE
jgi:hypothetical protein